MARQYALIRTLSRTFPAPASSSPIRTLPRSALCPTTATTSVRARALPGISSAPDAQFCARDAASTMAASRTPLFTARLPPPARRVPAPPFPYVFLNNAGLVVEPNAIYFDRLFQNPEINQTELSHCQLFGLIRPSSAQLYRHEHRSHLTWRAQSITTPRTPIQLIQHGSAPGKIVLWQRDQRQQHLALPSEADSGRLQIEFLTRRAGKCFPLFRCVFSPLPIAKEALPQVNAVLEIGLQAADHIHPSLAVLIGAIESALIFLPCRL